MFVWLVALSHAQEIEATTATSDTGLDLPLSDPGRGPQEVVGGREVREGRWDDAVGVVMFGSYIGCTGTLVGPRVVITAGHCLTGYPVTHVLVGSKDWLEEGGELIEVDGVYEYPDSWSTYDIGVLTLKTASTFPPRTVALDCVLTEHLKDGAAAQIVGFGITNENGIGFNSVLNEAATEILDKNCDVEVIDGIVVGCNPSVSPGGEIAAGGNGTDACYGDSGGPLYLKTDDGSFLVGVTSRAFIGVPLTVPCRDGGIWVRPDAVMDWIDDTVGPLRIETPVCNVAPEVELPHIETWSRGNHDATVGLSVTDEDGDVDDAVVEIAEDPERGTVSVDGLSVTYAPDDGFAGEDTFLLTVTDGGNARWERTGTPVTTEVWAEVTVHDGRPPLFSGCATSSSGAGWLGLVLPLVLARRTRVTG